MYVYRSSCIYFAMSSLCMYTGHHVYILQCLVYACIYMSLRIYFAMSSLCVYTGHYVYILQCIVYVCTGHV